MPRDRAVSHLMALYDLPDLMVYAVFMLGAAGLAASVCLGAWRLSPVTATKDQLDLAMRTSAAVVSALTLTLAFCAIQARSQTSEASRVVAMEVAAISGLARLADRLGEPGLRLHADITAYLYAVVHAEFPALAERGRDPATQHAAEALEHAAYAAAAQASDALAQDLIQQTDGVDEARENRLMAAEAGLPAAFWLLILLLMALLVSTGPLYPPRRHVAAMLAMQAAGVGALIAFVFLMDQPFRGHLSVSPEPYNTLQRSLAHRAAIATAARSGLLAASPAPQDVTRRVQDASAP
ncbi:hypothetical protein ACLF3G_20795 [Falsiroseomonas sp. HC035]|uniref:bestrophin-like domain n=1 Tax=Falsiroseomonas sp. HC035 TaxID=3390999 RepID=UPI003D312CC3